MFWENATKFLKLYMYMFVNCNYYKTGQVYTNLNIYKKFLKVSD